MNDQLGVLEFEEAVIRGVIKLPPDLPPHLVHSYVRSLKMHADIGCDPLDPTLDEVVFEGSAEDVIRFCDVCSTHPRGEGGAGGFLWKGPERALIMGGPLRNCRANLRG